jgi:hypothetical protein
VGTTVESDVVDETVGGTQTREPTTDVGTVDAANEAVPPATDEDGEIKGTVVAACSVVSLCSVVVVAEPAELQSIVGNVVGTVVAPGAGTVDVGPVPTEVVTGSSGCVVLTTNVDVFPLSVVVVEAVKLSGAQSSAATVVVVAGSTDVETISATTVDGIKLVSTLVGTELGATELGRVVAGAVLDGSEFAGTTPGTSVEPGTELGAIELGTNELSAVVKGAEVPDPNGKAVVVDSTAVASATIVKVVVDARVSVAATVVVVASLTGGCTVTGALGVVVVAWEPRSETAAGIVELGTGAGGFVTSLITSLITSFSASLARIDVDVVVVVFAAPADGSVVATWVELGESVEVGTPVDDGTVGADCVIVEEVLEPGEVEVVEASGSGHGTATVTETGTSAPFPREIVH